MSQQNPRWGYTRIRGALRNLGHEIGRNTIKRILSTNGIEPASIRRKGRQVARNLTDSYDGFLSGTGYLIHDRDPLFTAEFGEILKSAGVKTVRLPAQSPDLNAFAERFVRSIKEECLSHVIPLGERHLRWLVREYVKHYHLERNHQGLGNELIEQSSETGQGCVACRERLGGLLKHYYREAA